jgi:cation transport regulator ChaB
MTSRDDSRMPAKDELPGTLKRSPKKAQETWSKTHDAAVDSYGEGERAHRTAFSSLKHSFEKVGDHWEPKDHKGPSDPQAARGGRGARNAPRETFGGVDVLGHTRDELYARAASLQVRGRSRMTKDELARAIARKQD